MNVGSVPRPVRATLSALLRAGARLPGVRLPTFDGHDLDPEVAFGLALDRWRASTPMWELPPEEARRLARRRAAPYAPISSVACAAHDVALPARGGVVAARLYRPENAAPCPPAIVWFHSGGWVVGSVDGDDRLCRWIAGLARAVVVSVEYRLAPEHRFPAAHEDALDAWTAISARAEAWSIRPDALGVAGASAGGNLAASVCLALRDGGAPPPAAQLLLYPATDLRRQTRSHQEIGDGFVLDRPLMDWFLESFCDPSERVDPRVSILLADRLDGLPPAVVATAGFDPLRDEGDQYAERLRRSGGTVTHLRAHSLVHGFAEVSGGCAEARRVTVAAVEAFAHYLDPGTDPDAEDR